MVLRTIDVQFCGAVCHCSQGLADNCVIAKVNGDVWDLDRPLESDCKLRLLKFDDPDGLFCIAAVHSLTKPLDMQASSNWCLSKPG